MNVEFAFAVRTNVRIRTGPEVRVRKDYVRIRGSQVRPIFKGFAAAKQYGGTAVK